MKNSGPNLTNFDNNITNISHHPNLATKLPVRFNRNELERILNIYGHKVSSGEWRDYAIDMMSDKAIFSVFRRSSEHPIYRIEKAPKLARKQGMFSVISATGLILKRGHELKHVLRIFEKKPKLVDL